MEYTIEWGGDTVDLLVTTSGRATVEGLDAWVREVLADLRYRPGMAVLVDHRTLDWNSMTTQDLRRRVGLLQRDNDRIGRTRAALVTRRPIDYGLMRMMVAYLDERASFDAGVFYSLESAYEWLRPLVVSD